MKSMEELLKKALNSKLMKTFGFGGGGCINQGQGYETDSGQIFVKINSKSGAKQMFDGEFASLDAIYKTKTIRVPKPIKVIDNPKGGAFFVSEYIEMKGASKRQAELGRQLARLHLHNIELGKQGSPDYVSRFGFPVTTCCGYIPQDNSWTDNWPDFLIQKLQQQIDLILKDRNDAELKQLWAKLKPKMGDFFVGLDIKPSLLHGDLWGGNIAETDTEPVIFDPACFYGHNEYDFGIATIFGGFSDSFFREYFKVFPKDSGFDRRLKLYQLFHYLNHWNHFGTGYRSSSMSILRELS